MSRLAATALAVVCLVVPLLTAPGSIVAVTGGTGLLLALVGVVTLWRWPLTAAACVFLIDYAVALWLGAAPVSVVRAVGFGFSLFLLLESGELARGARRATVVAGAVRSQVLHWMGFGAATLATTMLVMALAGVVVASIPVAAAPFMAAAGALGVVLALAAMVTRTSRSGRRSHEAQ